MYLRDTTEPALRAQLTQARDAYARHRVRADGVLAKELLEAVRRQQAAHQVVEAMLAKEDIPALLKALRERGEADRELARHLREYEEELGKARDAQATGAAIERRLETGDRTPDEEEAVRREWAAAHQRELEARAAAPEPFKIKIAEGDVDPWLFRIS